jgi:hypothetical protein
LLATKLKILRVKLGFPDVRRIPLSYEPGGDRAIISMTLEYL